MKLTDIERMYTQKVMEFLNDGYIIIGSSTLYPGTMSYVNLRKGMEFVRVAIEEAHGCPAKVKRDFSFFDRLDILKIVVYRKTIEHENQFGWSINANEMNSQEIVSEWYDVSRDRMKHWYVDANEAAIANERNAVRTKDRYHRNDAKRYHMVTDDEDYLCITMKDDSIKKMVLPFLRRQNRCKSKKISDISYVKKEVRITNGRCHVLYGLVTNNHELHTIYASISEVK